MNELNDDEIDKIADRLYQKVDERARSFWIEPEQHYKSHQRMDDLLKVWDSTQNVFLKTIIGLFIIGMLTISSMPLWSKKVGGP